MIHSCWKRIILKKKKITKMECFSIVLWESIILLSTHLTKRLWNYVKIFLLFITHFLIILIINIIILENIYVISNKVCLLILIKWFYFQISIPLAQFRKDSTFDRVFSKMANILMCAYFTLDPYVYVLQRYFEKKRMSFCCCLNNSVNKSNRPSSSVEGGTPTSLLLNPPSFTTQTVM